jgi:pimeloyl-ACP methyl ester carboxylesterase
MKALQKAGKHVRVIHGDNDSICPLQCGLDLEKNYSNVSLSLIPGANHINILLGREKQMAQELEEEVRRS